MKLAGQMLDELRRDVFFRAAPALRAAGRGRRWLLLRAWERTSDTQKADLHTVRAGAHFRWNHRDPGTTLTAPPGIGA